MTDKERINELKKITGLNFRRLASEIGIKTVQTLYDIKNGKHGISKDLAEKIHARYLNINLAWLLTGEGDMLKDMDNTINQELKMFIARIKFFHGITQAQIAERLSVQSSYLSDMINGRVPFSEKFRERLLSVFSDALGGTGNTISVGTANSSTIVGGDYHNMAASTQELPIIEAEEVRAPIIPMSIVKTPNLDVLQYVNSHNTGIESSGIRVDNMPISVWHRVGDDALEPAYRKGDLLGLYSYSQGEEDPIPGKIYAVDTRSNGIVVRILYPDADGYRAHALNPNFEDFIIRKSNIIRIYRKMIMVRI